MPRVCHGELQGSGGTVEARPSLSCGNSLGTVTYRAYGVGGSFLFAGINEHTSLSWQSVPGDATAVLQYAAKHHHISARSHKQLYRGCYRKSKSSTTSKKKNPMACVPTTSIPMPLRRTPVTPLLNIVATLGGCARG